MFICYVYNPGSGLQLRRELDTSAVLKGCRFAFKNGHSIPQNLLMVTKFKNLHLYLFSSRNFEIMP